jgi:hypothetical protein
MKHEIAATDVLHDKIYSRFRLETGMEVGQEWVPLPVRDEEHPLLGSYALHFVVLDDELFLQNLDRV